MAIITLARQVAAWGDEVAEILASKLNYQFISRKEILDRLLELGFNKNKIDKYDERKPGFFASFSKERDAYFNLSQFAMLEAATKGNVIIIGRGAFAIFKNTPNLVSCRLVADYDTRITRLQKEKNITEKQAIQLIQESDANRNGFHKDFYNVDVDDSTNFHMVLNTAKMDLDHCAQIISDFTNKTITEQNEKEGKIYLDKLLAIQNVINKLIFEYKTKIDFIHADIEDDSVVLYGVSDSPLIVEQAIQIMKENIPNSNIVSRVSIIHNFKSYQ